MLLLLFDLEIFLILSLDTFKSIPITVSFLKAAPAYREAAQISFMQFLFSSLIANDADVSPYLQVIMMEYNVAAERYSSRQGYLYFTGFQGEAYGTSNMKFTVCTVDGANLKYCRLGRQENIYAFGASSDEVVLTL